MPRATSPVESDNSDNQPSKDKATTEPESEGDDEDGEEEYEIEAIMDAKRGVFAEGRIGYLVKWKGYDSKDNSWVDEKDIGNAEELVQEFWKRHPKKQANVLTKKKSRLSTGDGLSEAGRKRGRKSITREESDDEDPPAPSRSAKKAKKQTNNGISGRTQSPEIGAEMSSMNDYKHLKNWEDVVKSVDTVERTEDGKLFVYFTLHNGSQVKEPSEVCKSRFPVKLIEFYESNLRWKAADDD